MLLLNILVLKVKRKLRQKTEKRTEEAGKAMKTEKAECLNSF